MGTLVRSARDVAGAITSSTFTTVAVFAPIGLVGGVMVGFVGAGAAVGAGAGAVGMLGFGAVVCAGAVGGVGGGAGA